MAPKLPPQHSLQHSSTTAADGQASHPNHTAPSGIMRWLLTTNHKEIGSLYLIFSLTMFFIGGIFALVVRAELFQPGLQLVEPEFFNQMTTMHGLIMVFAAVMPAFTGLANWMIPLRIPANVTGHYGDRDRFAHGLHAGESFVR